MGKVADSIQEVLSLVDTARVRVAEFKIAPKKEGAYHYHTHVVEHCVYLEGTVRIEVSDHLDQVLKPGERIEISAGMVHRVINSGIIPCRFLVIQGLGIYDFVEGWMIQ